MGAATTHFGGRRYRSKELGGTIGVPSESLIPRWQRANPRGRRRRGRQTGWTRVVVVRDLATGA